MELNKENIVKLGIDLYKGKVKNYSTDEGNEVIRKAMKEFMDLTTDGKLDFKKFRRNKLQIFEIIEEVVTETVNEGLSGQFDNLVEFKNYAWGDKPEFEVPNNQLYRVAQIVDGNGNIRRQQLRENETIKVDYKTYGVKIFEEYHRFLAGRVDWAKMMKVVGESFQEQLKNVIFDTLMATYAQAYKAPYHVTGTPSEDQLVDIASHIKARTGDDVAIYGTLGALRKITPAVISDNMRDKRNADGFYGVISGLNAFEIPNSHKIGTDDFVITDDFVLLLPQTPDRLIKVLSEGQAVMQDTSGGVTSDMVQEYFIGQRFGVAVISSKAFGFYKFQ